MKRITKWGSLCERIAKVQEDESIILEPEGDLTEEARNIHDGLYGIRVCDLVRLMVKFVDGNIVITRVGTRRTLRGF